MEAGSERVVANALLAFTMGVGLVHIYRSTHQSVKYSVRFVSALAFVPLVTALAILLTGSALLPAFGVLGAVSVIGLRAGRDNPRDLVFLALAFGVGSVAGLGPKTIVAVATLMTFLVLLYVRRLAWVGKGRGGLLLRVVLIPDERGALLHEPILDQYVRRSRMLAVRPAEKGRTLQVTYLISLRRPESASELTGALRAIDGIEDVLSGNDELSSDGCSGNS